MDLGEYVLVEYTTNRPVFTHWRGGEDAAEMSGGRFQQGEDVGFWGYRVGRASSVRRQPARGPRGRTGQRAPSPEGRATERRALLVATISGTPTTGRDAARPAADAQQQVGRAIAVRGSASTSAPRSRLTSPTWPRKNAVGLCVGAAAAASARAPAVAADTSLPSRPGAESGRCGRRKAGRVCLIGEGLAASTRLERRDAERRARGVAYSGRPPLGEIDCVGQGCARPARPPSPGRGERTADRETRAA